MATSTLAILKTNVPTEGPLFTMQGEQNLDLAHQTVLAKYNLGATALHAYLEIFEELKAQRASNVAQAQIIADLRAELDRKEAERAEAAAVALEAIKESAFAKTLLGKIQTVLNEDDQTSVML